MRLLYSSDGPFPHALPAGELTEAELAIRYRHRVADDGGVWLRCNLVTSLDGAVTGPDGRTGSINTPSDHLVFALHRAHADAIVVGAQTVRSERYRAVDLAPWQRELRRAEGLSSFPTLAVVTHSLELGSTLASAGALDVGPVVVFTTAGKSQAAVAPVTAAGVEVVQLGSAEVDLVEVTRQLAQRGCLRLLTEGGPRLHAGLLAAGLVDELSMTLAPVMVGGDGGRTTTGDWLTGLAFRLRFALHADDETVFLNYVRSTPSQR